MASTASTDPPPPVDLDAWEAQAATPSPPEVEPGWFWRDATGTFWEDRWYRCRDGWWWRPPDKWWKAGLQEALEEIAEQLHAVSLKRRRQD